MLDPEASDGMRAKIQETIQGAEVLDVGHFPEFHFRSTGVEPDGTDHWMVYGNLDLHGQPHPISFQAALKDGLHQGTAVIRQAGFGFTPVKIGGGTVKVKDQSGVFDCTVELGRTKVLAWSLRIEGSSAVNQKSLKRPGIK